MAMDWETNNRAQTIDLQGNMILLMRLNLLPRLGVVEVFEQLHLHGVADLIVLGREEVEEGCEDALAKEDNK